MSRQDDSTKERFQPVYEQRPAVVAYCRRRGSQDPEGIAAETMEIAWRRLGDLDPGGCLPWLIATARNLLLAEYRANNRSVSMDPVTLEAIDPRKEPEFEIESLDPVIDRALTSLSADDREALLLIAWEDLTPAAAAESLGITATAFRVRLHRARRRFKKSLNAAETRNLVPAGQPLEEKS